MNFLKTFEIKVGEKCIAQKTFHERQLSNEASIILFQFIVKILFAKASFVVLKSLLL